MPDRCTLDINRSIHSSFVIFAVMIRGEIDGVECFYLSIPLIGLVRVLGQKYSNPGLRSRPNYSL
jgi:hypothetical protein